MDVLNVVLLLAQAFDPPVDVSKTHRAIDNVLTLNGQLKGEGLFEQRMLRTNGHH